MIISWAAVEWKIRPTGAAASGTTWRVAQYNYLLDLLHLFESKFQFFIVFVYILYCGLQVLIILTWLT